jgi:hypothetical protein
VAAAEPRARTAPIGLLLACLAIGGGIGAAGWLLTGGTGWFLALPVVIALGWLFVADPTRCEAGPAATARSDDAGP